jgi:glucose-1-phosphate adenylyltransferase
MSIDSEQRITRFTEKPANPEPMPGNHNKALASMGIYIFNTRFLYEQLLSDADNPASGHDFGHDVIPAAIDKYNVYAYPFIDIEGKVQKEAYWRDVGTVDAFWQANQELIGVSPELNLYDDDWPIWTYQEQLPPAKFVFDDDERRGMAVDSMVSGGCIISGALLKHSLLFSHVRIDSYTEVFDSVVLPNVEIGEHCHIHKAVIDKGCKIPDGMQIGVNEAEDRERFHISEKGVVLVTPEMLGQELHYVR